MMSRFARNTRFRVISPALCLTLGLSLVLTSSLPSVQARDVSIYDKLSEYEQMLFGESENSAAIDKRLQKLEKNLFGQVSKRSTAARIAEIDRVLSGKSDSRYLPPVAPGLDRSEFAPTPKQAPNSVATLDELDAPLPADSADKVKGLLRQAIEKYSQGKTAEAERIYQQVLAVDFRNVDANYNLGAIAEGRGDLKAADRYYSAALKNNPSDLELQDAAKAVKEKLARQNPTGGPDSGSFEADRSRSSATGPHSGRTPAGRNHPAQGASASSEPAGAPATASDKAIAAEAADAFKRGNFDDAISKLNYLARKRPFDPDTQFALGQALRGKNKPEEALRHMRAAASLAPQNDLYVRTLNELQSQVDERQTANSDSAGGPSYGRTGQTSSGNQDVLPFTGLADGRSSSGLGDLGDLAGLEAYMRRNAGSVLFGSASDMVNPPAGLGSMGVGYYGFGFPGVGSSPGSTRLRRAVTSSLSGAAIGALSNRGYSGGMKRGAMRGAMYGGLYGLLLGN